jgi:phage-related protein
MKDNIIRTVVYYENYYFDFYSKLKPAVQKKFDWTISLIEQFEKVPKKYFDHLTGSDGLWEIRVEYESNIYRVFTFFDKGKLIIAMNGFQKKSQKTPTKEIKLAEKLKKQYFDETEK